MLENFRANVLQVTINDLRLFSSAACYITQSSTFSDCLFVYVPAKNGFKYPVLLIDIF